MDTGSGRSVTDIELRSLRPMLAVNPGKLTFRVGYCECVDAYIYFTFHKDTFCFHGLQSSLFPLGFQSITTYAMRVL